MYKVSPMPKPMIPLRLARTIAYAGRLVKIWDFPSTNRPTTKIKLVHMQRAVFAEIGFVTNNALRYSTADTAQHIAAPNAASSPIIYSQSS
jgi:hypothetical protein